MMFPPIDPSVLNGNPQFDKLYSYLTTVALNPSGASRSEEHTSELQSQSNIVCRLLLEKKITRYQHGKRNRGESGGEANSSRRWLMRQLVISESLSIELDLAKNSHAIQATHQSRHLAIT